MRFPDGSPRIMCQSSGLSDAARTLTRTCRGFGTGIGRSVSFRTSGEPWVEYAIAFICVGIWSVAVGI
jgi:hypothetical protein